LELGGVLEGMVELNWGIGSGKSYAETVGRLNVAIRFWEGRLSENWCGCF
jgi:hypothetical protein